MSKIDMEIEIPEELTDAMEVLSTVISPVMKDVGVLVMGEHFHPNHGSDMPTVRLFLLRKSESSFWVDGEIDAFRFHDYEFAQAFVNRLPEMSALEILILMNGIQLDEESVTYH